MSAPITKPAPTLAVSVEGACQALGIGWDLWKTIEPEIRVVRLGRRKLIPIVELEKWLDQHAEAVGDR